MRYAFFVSLLWLTACASQPREFADACLTQVAQVSGQFAMTVATESGTHQFVVVVRQQGQQLQFMGFNTIGAKAFTAKLQDARIVADPSRLYRGPKAENLLWGLLVHQAGAEAGSTYSNSCWNAPPYQVEQTDAPDGWAIRRGRQLIFISESESAFVLPSANVRVDIQPLG